MKKYNLLSLALVVLVILGAFSCKETTTKENPVEEKTISQAPVETKETMPVLDASLDPLVVGKDFSKVFSDTLNVQMYEMTLKPGDSIGLHQHLDHSVYVLQGGKLMVYINGTDPVKMDLKAGTGFVSGPLTDSAKNVGDTTVKILVTEIHRPREN